MKPLRKTRPQHHADECPECNGLGGTWQDDSDEDGRRMVFASCEWCDNCGSVAQCDRCDESMPLTAAELNGYVCVPCLAAAERGDMVDEMARIRRVG